ncbi:hypothetical protein [Natronococcus sp.]|uniref:hypothetical protein n=1 Tax=Natronococcus sp. TaxID=35747 RepID=UPI0025FFDD00|nr:hypothetical protein [Natronococcus sp.]
MTRARTVGLGLVLATGLLRTTIRVSGYELQVLSALLTMGVALAAVVAFRSLDSAGEREYLARATPLVPPTRRAAPRRGS